MMKPKYLLMSAALMAMLQATAMPPVKAAKVVKKQAAKTAKVVKKQATSAVADKDAPAYTIVGKDSTCRIFIYSPAPDRGLHLAYLTDDDRWVDVGQLCSSD